MKVDKHIIASDIARVALEVSYYQTRLLVQSQGPWDSSMNMNPMIVLSYFLSADSH